MALVVTAIGGSLIKPSIVGTVARTTTPETASLGYSIYYTLVNFGGAVGPMLAMLVRQNVGISYVLVMSSLTSLALVLGTLIFYKEPPRPADAPPPTSMAKVVRDMLTVFRNVRFMAFLAIFSGFWAMFWHVFYALPFYVRDYLKFERFEIIETVDAWTDHHRDRPDHRACEEAEAADGDGARLRPRDGVLVHHGGRPHAHVHHRRDRGVRARRGPAVSPLLRVRGQPRPKEQVGTYMGVAFLPIALGTFIAGCRAASW